MKQTYLPGTIRERIKDLMKSKKLTQTELCLLYTSVPVVMFCQMFLFCFSVID